MMPMLPIPLPPVDDGDDYCTGTGLPVGAATSSSRRMRDVPALPPPLKKAHMEQSQAIRYQLIHSLFIALLISYWGYIRLIIVSSDDDRIINNNSSDDDVDLKVQEQEELFNEEF